MAELVGVLKSSRMRQFGGCPEICPLKFVRFLAKATLIYWRAKNLRGVQLFLGHSNLDSTARYLGIEIDDALEMAERIDV